MSKHLTDEQLQAHLFDLDNGASAGHLTDCAECTARLEKLTRQFSALNELKENPAVRDEVVQATLKQVAESGRAPSHTRWIPIASAAGFLLLASLLWVLSQRPIEDQDPIARVPTPPTQQETAELDRGPLARPVPEELLVELRKTTPFVPGSNIELNVLPRREKVQLSIYNKADLTLVRDQRQLTLKEGWNWLQFMWANTLIDPTSLQLEPTKLKDKVEVQQLVFPPRMTGVGRWLIFSEVSGRVPFEITYLTSGIAWRSFYMGTLSPDEQSMRLQGYVRVENNSGEDYEDAQTRLVVGKVNVLDQISELAKRKHAYGSPIPVPGAPITESAPPHNYYMDFRMSHVQFDSPILGDRANFDMVSLKEIRKEGLSEYFLYSIEGRETIPNTSAKRLPSFDVADVPVKSFYRYHDTEYGSQVMRYLKFTNNEDHNLGETPLPDGTVKVYHQLDADQHLSFVGSAHSQYIPVDEEAKLNLGPAQQVTIELDIMDRKEVGHVFDPKGNVAGWDEINQWQMVVNNTRNLPVEMEITRFTGGKHWEIRFDGMDGVKYRKLDLEHARFDVQLAAGEKKIIRYQQTTFHGERENR